MKRRGGKYRQSRLMLRSTTFWRGFLLVLACLAVLANARLMWQWNYANGDPGVTLPDVQGFVGPIVVAPDSAAYRAGARTGDVIDGRMLSNADRYKLWSGNYLAGETVQLPVRTSAGLHVIDVVRRERHRSAFSESRLRSLPRSGRFYSARCSHGGAPTRRTGGYSPCC